MVFTWVQHPAEPHYTEESLLTLFPTSVALIYNSKAVPLPFVSYICISILNQDYWTSVLASAFVEDLIWSV